MDVNQFIGHCLIPLDPWNVVAICKAVYKWHIFIIKIGVHSKSHIFRAIENQGSKGIRQWPIN